MLSSTNLKQIQRQKRNYNETDRRKFSLARGQCFPSFLLARGQCFPSFLLARGQCFPSFLLARGQCLPSFYWLEANVFQVFLLLARGQCFLRFHWLEANVSLMFSKFSIGLRLWISVSISCLRNIVIKYRLPIVFIFVT